jgi:hypothetical protein
MAKPCQWSLGLYILPDEFSTQLKATVRQRVRGSVELRGREREERSDGEDEAMLLTT